MTQNRNIRAFTVMEFTIAMVITSLVVGFGYQTITLFTGKAVKQARAKDESGEWMALENTLTSDFTRSEYVDAEDRAIVCYWPGKEVRYACIENAILRETELATDTFHVTPVQWNLRWGVTEKTYGWIDALTLEARSHGRSFLLTCQKTYDALHLMQYEHTIGN